MMRVRSSPRGARRRALAHARSGFALPLALLLVVLMTVLAASSLAFVGAEQRSAGTQLAQVGAVAVARSGMEQYLAERATVVAPAAAESARVTFANGYADVLVSRVHDGAVAGGPHVYLVRSHGVMTDSMSGRILAERTVAQYARWQDSTMNVLAAWTSYTGISKPDGLGLIDGDDACGARAAVAGAAVPAVPGLTQAGASASIARGTPPVLTLTPGAPPTGLSVLSIGSMVADGAIPGAINLAHADWPEPSEWADPAFWPTLIAPDGFTLTENGRGVLIVAGDLTVTSTRSWSGVLLVGGNVIVTGNFTVDGAIISGVSLAGVTSSPSMAGAGNVAYRYNSCAVAKALSRYRGLTPYRNAMTDNWPTY